MDGWITNGPVSLYGKHSKNALLDATQFETCFVRWMSSICPSLEGQHIAVDGKRVRGSHDGRQSPIHLVSAWSSAGGLTLGQVRTADKSNEITAIPELLATLDIKSALITIDAMGCQHDIAGMLVASGADYVPGAKDSQPGLAEAVKLRFDAADTGTMERRSGAISGPKKITDGSKPGVAWSLTTSPGMDTYHSAWMVEDNWIGFLAFVVITII